ncbi:MAG TPA: hypothetical protein VFW83_05965 [Bryobacteraceae bacterium]|nr:hypothetical protein [Bryobacteraceae bacterium]
MEIGRSFGKLPYTAVPTLSQRSTTFIGFDGPAVRSYFCHGLL